MADKRKTIEGYLVVDASGEMRAVKRQPRLNFTEVAFPIRVTIPITWGKIQSPAITLDMPEPPEAIVSYTEALLPEVPDAD